MCKSKQKTNATFPPSLFSMQLQKSFLKFEAWHSLASNSAAIPHFTQIKSKHSQKLSLPLLHAHLVTSWLCLLLWSPSLTQLEAGSPSHCCWADRGPVYLRIPALDLLIPTHSPIYICLPNSSSLSSSFCSTIHFTMWPSLNTYLIYSLPRILAASLSCLFYFFFFLFLLQS